MLQGLMRGKMPDNDIILYDEQDENLWDQDLIQQGIHFLNLSAQGGKLKLLSFGSRDCFLELSKRRH